MSKTEDERFAKFDSHLDCLLRAIRLCYEQECIIPSMMLIYAGIDGMAWLYREHDNENTGQDFREWVDRFWLEEKGGITSSDLWSARNALLHEQSSNSRLSRSGIARAFFYLWGKARAAVPLGGQWKVPPLFVRAEDMILSFQKATTRFRQFIQDQAKPRQNQILSRCGEWFDVVMPQGHSSG